MKTMTSKHKAHRDECPQFSRRNTPDNKFDKILNKSDTIHKLRLSAPIMCEDMRPSVFVLCTGCTQNKMIHSKHSLKLLKIPDSNFIPLRSHYSVSKF